MAELKYLPAGIRLHLKKFFYKLRGGVPGEFYFHFPSIPVGLKAEAIARAHRLPFASIPIPDEIYPQCGVGLVVEEADRLKKVLIKHQIQFELYRRTKEGFQKVEGHFPFLD
ncbi:MAG: DUF3343 domain-containing protein [Campylobacterales bacterium]